MFERFKILELTKALLLHEKELTLSKQENERLTKAKEDLGWEHRTSFARLVQEMVNADVAP